MNRKQRRQAAHNRPQIRPLTQAEKTEERLFRNGITDKDLERAHMEGFTEGYRFTLEATKTAYAAVAVALKELYGFGQKRIAKTLIKADELVKYSLSSDDMAEEALDKCGVRIDMNAEALNGRVGEKED